MTSEDRQLRPERLAQVAEHLDEAINEFRAWGVRVAQHGRLEQMSRLLKATGTVGSFPRDEYQLSVLSEAIGTSQDFIEIANALPKEPIPSVQHDLRIAVGGDLRPFGAATGAHLRHQTQLWVGSMLAQSGADVGVLIQPSSEKNPDFILTNGTLKYAVEVKRPNGELDARNIIRKAARQIRSAQFHGGMIVVDLTECLTRETRFRCGRGEPDLSGAEGSMNRLLGALHQEIFDDAPEMLRPRREHVFGLIGFARIGYWDMDSLAYPHHVRYVGTVRYWRQHHRTLRAHRARWLSDLIHQGIGAVGHEASGAVPIEWTPPLG